MILAIDTSGAIAVAAVSETGEVLASRSEFAPRGHAELLSGMIEAALNDAGGERPSRIVVGTGPATFTGLRVGLVTARTLGYAWDVPVQGVCSLDALGAQFGTCTVVTDARRKEVYWARYVEGTRVGGPAVAAPTDVPAQAPVIGRGALLYPSVFSQPTAADPSPAFLVRVADLAIASGLELPTEPLYLRRPDVHAGTVTVVIRDLTTADLDWVAEQERAIFGPAAWSSSLIREDFANGGTRYRGALVDGRLVGYAVYGFDGDVFHLMNIAVVADARRTGVGRALMEDFLEQAAAVDAPEVWLEVSVENPAAIALYRDYGFEDVRIRPRYYQPQDADALVMRKRM